MPGKSNLLAPAPSTLDTLSILVLTAPSLASLLLYHLSGAIVSVILRLGCMIFNCHVFESPSTSTLAPRSSSAPKPTSNHACSILHLATGDIYLGSIDFDTSHLPPRPKPARLRYKLGKPDLPHGFTTSVTLPPSSLCPYTSQHFISPSSHGPRLSYPFSNSSPPPSAPFTSW